MITTITPNPSIDHTIRLERLVPEAVHRATSTSTEPSGKGINVALALHHAGVAAEAVLPLGGASGSQLRGLLQGHGLPVRIVPIANEVRTNVTVVDAVGATTKFNEVGPRLTDDEASALIAASAPTDPGGWIVWAGSLPPGFSPTHLASAIAASRAASRLVALDCSGFALRQVLNGNATELPTLIKPNADELTELTGRALSSIGEVVDVARDLIASGVHEVLVSLGGDGAVLVTRTGAWHGTAPVRRVVNTAGAGDALLAGYLAAAGSSDSADRLASALRFGADAVEQPGTLLTVHSPNRAVSVGPADRATALSSPTIPQENS